MLITAGKAAKSDAPDDFPTLITQARQEVEERNVEGALKLYEKAYNIKPSAKLRKRISKIRVSSY